jgi:hypothetical protein
LKGRSQKKQEVCTRLGFSSCICQRKKMSKPFSPRRIGRGHEVIQ